MVIVSFSHGLEERKDGTIVWVWVGPPVVASSTAVTLTVRGRRYNFLDSAVS